MDSHFMRAEGVPDRPNGPTAVELSNFGRPCQIGTTQPAASGAELDRIRVRIECTSGIDM